MAMAAGTIGIGNTAHASDAVSNPNIHSSSATLLTAVGQEAQFEEILTRLENLPDDLKNADPRTTPNYEARLNEALGGITILQGLQPTGGLSAQTNWGKCAIEVAKVIVTYGIPVAKVVKWIKEARAIWGGVRGILAAIRAGDAAAKIGPEAVAVLEGILGIGGVRSACFN
ncbi:MAG: hypothetical protein LKI58_09145 [Actinomyces sp.]|jgi:hypothetical protein|nr:hypothetical protein [Actinomyces sp.]MCI1788217.1 hypothetical protein [Actinomyces sp.]MCI1830053.1 hypothetical protein [Actinomyces sp.]MCI1866492.1 hypothetical protein [Actinomyces sp.]